MRSRAVRLATAVVAGMLVGGTGCGSRKPVAAAPVLASFPLDARVALAPLENLTNDPGAADALSSTLDGALRAAGARVTPPLVGALPRGRRASVLEVQQAAAVYGARYALTGSVVEFGFRDAAIPGDPAEPIVAVDLALLEVASGRSVWTATFAAGAVRGERRTLSGVARAVARDVAQALAPAATETVGPAGPDAEGKAR